MVETSKQLCVTFYLLILSILGRSLVTAKAPTVKVCLDNSVTRTNVAILDSAYAPTHGKETCFCHIKLDEHPRTASVQAIVSFVEGSVLQHISFNIGHITFNDIDDRKNVTLPLQGINVTYESTDFHAAESAQLKIEVRAHIKFTVSCKRNTKYGESSTSPSSSTQNKPQDVTVSTQGTEDSTVKTGPTPVHQNDENDKTNLIYLAVGAGVGVVVLGVIILAVVIIVRRRGPKDSNKGDGDVKIQNHMYNTKQIDKNGENVIMEYEHSPDDYSTISCSNSGKPAEEEHYAEPLDSYSVARPGSEGYSTVPESNLKRVDKASDSAGTEYGYSKPVTKIRNEKVEKATKVNKTPKHDNDSVYDHTTDQVKVIPFNEYSHIRNVPKGSLGRTGATNTYDTAEGVKYTRAERKISEPDESYDTTIA